MSPNLLPMASREEVWVDSVKILPALLLSMLREQREELGLLLPDYL